MPAVTPHAKGHERLAAFASRYVNVDELPWVPTRFPGVDLKILMEDKETGVLTALTRFAPGAVLPKHEHVEIEQSHVLEGVLEDDEGVVSAGRWRERGESPPRAVAWRAPCPPRWAGCYILCPAFYTGASVRGDLLAFASASGGKPWPDGFRANWLSALPPAPALGVQRPSPSPKKGREWSPPMSM
jgi:hypothetical protein